MPRKKKALEPRINMQLRETEFCPCGHRFLSHNLNPFTIRCGEANCLCLYQRLPVPKEAKAYRKSRESERQQKQLAKE